jgi:hypothetical protein
VAYACILKCFLYSGFKASGLIARSLIHLEFSFVQGEIKVLFQSSTCRYPVSLASFVRDCLFSNKCLSHPCQNQMSESLWAYFWVLNSFPLIYVTAFVPVQCCFCYYGSIVQFEIKIMIPPALLFSSSMLSCVLWVFCAST